MKAFFSGRGIPLCNIILSARYQGKAAALPLRNYGVFFFFLFFPYVGQKYNCQTIKKIAPHQGDIVKRAES